MTLSAREPADRLDAFSTEHRRCGDLDGGVDEEIVWITCTCGASMPAVRTWTTMRAVLEAMESRIAGGFPGRRRPSTNICVICAGGVMREDR